MSAIGYQSTHYRVDQVLLPTVKLSKTEVTRASPTFNNVAADSHRQPSPTITPVATPPLNSTISVNLDIYDINFDDLPASEKCEQIVMLLETLPSIQVRSLRHSFLSIRGVFKLVFGHEFVPIHTQDMT